MRRRAPGSPAPRRPPAVRAWSAGFQAKMSAWNQRRRPRHEARQEQRGGDRAGERRRAGIVDVGDLRNRASRDTAAQSGSRHIGSATVGGVSGEIGGEAIVARCRRARPPVRGRRGRRRSASRGRRAGPAPLRPRAPAHRRGRGGLRRRCCRSRPSGPCGSRARRPAGRPRRRWRSRPPGSGRAAAPAAGRP